MLTLGEEESGAHGGKREPGPPGATTAPVLQRLLPFSSRAHPGRHSREQTTLPRVPGTQGRVSPGGTVHPRDLGWDLGQLCWARSLSLPSVWQGKVGAPSTQDVGSCLSWGSAHPQAPPPVGVGGGFGAHTPHIRLRQLRPLTSVEGPLALPAPWGPGGRTANPA